jgi:hypothetical protein
MPASFELRSFPGDQALSTAAARDWLTLIYTDLNEFSAARSN